jgi:hypothetical protein
MSTEFMELLKKEWVKKEGEMKELILDLNLLKEKKFNLHRELHALEHLLGETLTPFLSETERKGFRGSLREILSQGPPGGLRPRDVVKEFIRVGFDYPNHLETPLNIRITNELVRMFSVGQLDKISGKYSLKEVL